MEGSSRRGVMDGETTRALMEQLRRDADRICERFRLQLGSLEPESPRVRSRYGICYSDGTIRIRLRHVTTGQPLRYSSLVNTLCHELAHLRHLNHGPRFKALYLKILDWARCERIYRPRVAEEPILDIDAAPRTAKPVQLSLFQGSGGLSRSAGRTLPGYSGPRRPWP